MMLSLLYHLHLVWGSVHRVVPCIISAGHPTLINSIFQLPPKYAQKFVTLVLLDCVKYTMLAIPINTERVKIHVIYVDTGKWTYNAQQ